MAVPIEERVAALEAVYKHLATKADLLCPFVWVSSTFSNKLFGHHG